MGQLLQYSVLLLLIIVITCVKISISTYTSNLNVKVYTSADIWRAGTDARVFITIYGQSGDTRRIKLNKRDHDDFEKGSVASYPLYTRDIGIVESINIRLGERCNYWPWGSSDRWHLNKIIVHDNVRGTDHEFTCNCWINGCWKRLYCPVNGVWGDWESWSQCSATCGVGTQRRNRLCNNPSPSNNGTECYGDPSARKQCTAQQCPVHGTWTSWNDWSQCSVTCGGGTRRRTRSCSNPAPSSDGRGCDGDATSTEICSVQHCPVDGFWSDWGTWGSCAATCGAAVQQRHRSCTNPPPSNGGQGCPGSTVSSRNCTRPSCKVDGFWSDWSTWGSCAATCGAAVQQRHRSCTNPPPSNGGQRCHGSAVNSHNCTLPSCKVDGFWSDWSAWSSCSATCGEAVQQRHRSCTNPPPSNGGQRCTGAAAERGDLKCLLPSCEVIPSASQSTESMQITEMFNSQDQDENNTDDSSFFHNIGIPILVVGASLIVVFILAVVICRLRSRANLKQVPAPSISYVANDIYSEIGERALANIKKA